jgi:LPXTG-site transpeptidase (sortase) family protein
VVSAPFALEPGGQDGSHAPDAGDGAAVRGRDAIGAPGTPGGVGARRAPGDVGDAQGAAQADGQGAAQGAGGSAAVGAQSSAARQAFVPPPHSERTADGRQTLEPRAASDAIGVDIPAIGVRSRLVRLGLDHNRELEVPDDFSLAGWFTHGPAPAEPGPAVIAGHVDSRRGGAVFRQLERLEPGDLVHVHRADGLVATYRVDRVEQHPKDAFPTEAVYGNTADAQLRLITCGGALDLRRRTHRDNVIVFATLASTGPAAGT